jgi:type IV fimbrial biogenesis protein FimT
MTPARAGSAFHAWGTRPAPRARGFTIVELMVSLAVLAILLTLAVPSFTNATLGARLSAYANDLLASTQLARSEAIKRNAPVTLCASSDGTTCATSGNWRVGWIVRLADGTVLQRQQALPAEFRVTQGTFGAITFPATVIGVTPATFTVCRASPVGRQERVVTVTASGSASVRTTETGSCS